MQSLSSARRWRAATLGLFVVAAGLGPLWSFVPRASAVVYFSDNFDPPALGWTATDNGAGTTWQLGAPTAGPAACHSVPNCYGTNLNGDYTNDAAATLTSPAIDLTAATVAWLHVWHWYWTQPASDIATLYVGDGLFWIPLAAFDGIGNTWQLAEYDLSGFVGLSIFLRFELRTDSSIVAPGWFVDDVLVDDQAPVAPNELTVTPTVLAPPTAQQGQGDVPMLQLDLTVGAGAVDVDAFDVDLSGNPPSTADIALVELWLDDGSGTFNAGLDFLLAADTFTPAALLDPAGPLVVNPSNPETLFIVFDISMAATVGDYVGALMVDETYVNVASGAVLPANFPINSYQPGVRTQIVAATPDTLDVSGTVLAPASAMQGQSDVGMLRLVFSTTTGSVDVVSIRVRLSGTPPLAADVAQAEIWWDDGDGVFEPAADLPLQAQTFAGSPPEATFTPPIPMTVSAGMPVTLFIVYDIAAGATVGDWIGAALLDNTYVAVTPPDTVSAAGFPIDSYQAGVRTQLVVLNAPPTLDWTGELNYVADGLDPETGGTATSYVYRVEYTDADDDPPMDGAPYVHIRQGLLEIGGSPFLMVEVDPFDTTYSDGKWYTYTASGLPVCATDYTYYFSASDDQGASATGAPTSPMNAPDVTGCGGAAPALSATGETYYTSDGLHPESGTTATSFIYHVNYTDSDNDAPMGGWPELHVLKGGAEITGSPFAMSGIDPADTTYSDGKWYTVTRQLTAAGTDYTYFFTASDVNGNAAANWPDPAADAPDVTVALRTITVIVQIGGSAAADVSVRLLQSGTQVGSSVTTGANGQATFSGLTPGAYALEASKAGYETKTQSVDTTSGDQSVTMTLDPLTGTISGVVRCGDTPAANAKVELLNGTGAVVRTGTTGSDGSYRFDDVPLGTYEVRSAPEGCEAKTSPAILTEVQPTTTVDIVALRPGLPWWLLLLPLAAVLVLLVLFFVLKRRKKKEPETLAAWTSAGAPPPGPATGPSPPPSFPAPSSAPSAAARYCSSCGSEVPPGSPMCPRCGTPQ